jgi:TonB family protein
MLHTEEPQIPAEAKNYPLSGTTTVILIVDRQGKPQNVRVLRSLADKADAAKRPTALLLDQAAVTAVTKYRFAPAQEGGKPVPVETAIVVRFTRF